MATQQPGLRVRWQFAQLLRQVERTICRREPYITIQNAPSFKKWQSRYAARAHDNVYQALVATKLLFVILVHIPLLFLLLALKHTESPAAQLAELVAQRKLIQMMA